MAQHFPAIGDYFNNNDILLPGPGFDHGFFFNLVEASQEVGERPTAAFPSSHVGISTIVMIMAYRVNKKLCYFLGTVLRTSMLCYGLYSGALFGGCYCRLDFGGMYLYCGYLYV